jgi:hypothetical protein
MGGCPCHNSLDSRWIPTAAARVSRPVRSCVIRGGQIVTRAGFPRVLQFPLPIIILPNYLFS